MTSELKIARQDREFIDVHTGRTFMAAANDYRRIMCGIALTGTVRAEWMFGRYGQVIPCNWSMTDAIQWLIPWSPIKHLVADARNILATKFVEQGFDWLFFLDHDVVIPQDTILKLNDRMIKGDIPVWSGLYFTKSVPAEPLIYRGRGTGYYADWKLGDQVWVDGIPMGCTMIHSSIMKALYDESESYQVPTVAEGVLTVRKIFETPARIWYDPERSGWFSQTGTEDLEWCSRVMRNDIFKKAGWPKYQKKKYPFMVDTSLFCKHIDMNGIQYPSRGEQEQFVRK